MSHLFAADGENLVLGRGALLLDRFDANGASTGLRFVGNVSDLRLSTSDELREKFSSVSAGSPLLKRTIARRTIEFVAVCDEFTLENLALALMAEQVSVNQASAVTQVVAINDVLQGYWYDVGHKNLTTPVFRHVSDTPIYVVNTDYIVDATNGFVYIVPGGGIADGTDIEFAGGWSATTITRLRGGLSSTISARMVFQSDNASGPNYRIEAWKVSITPDGETGFISDDFGNFTIRMAVEADAVNHPTEPNYILDQVGA